jgi:hypothetical protein
MSHLQAGVLLVEVGVIALAALAGLLRSKLP